MPTTRRSFLKHLAAASAAGPILLPTLAHGASAADTVRVACVGVGGKGASDSSGAAGVRNTRIVAFADVETGPGARRGGFAAAAKKWPHAKRFIDWRVMLDEMHKEIDALTVSTPDHMHAPITMTALAHGIACYTQKPLTRTIYEARQLTRAAQRAKVATQMGNQHHNGMGYRLLFHYIRDGAIGKVKEAHAWSNRPIWPQGIDRPEGSDPVPKGFHWDLWLGVAPERPFKKDVYHPFKWRGWYDFGAGALGDMGCHIIDPVVWSLDLGPALSVRYDGPAPKPETFPTAETLTYRFKGTAQTAGDEITVKWYDGGRLPPADLAPLPQGMKGLPQNGTLFVGEKGVLLCEHGSGPMLLPRERFADYQKPKLETIDHYAQWIDAVRGQGQTTSSFAYAGPLTETVLLGVVASRVPGETLEWDSKELKFTNSAKATGYVRPTYRKGWEVEGLS